MNASWVILDYIAKLLREKIPQLGKANCIVTATPMLLPQLGRRYAQVYFISESFDEDGGGNLSRVMTFGVRWYEVLKTEAFQAFIRQSREMLTTSEVILKLLHNNYDLIQVPLQEPVKGRSRGAIVRVEPGKPVFYINCEYSVKYVETFPAIKGGA